MKLHKEESDALMRIINSVFEINLCADNKKREVVDARRIYTKILRDRGYTFQEIGDFISKNHSTVIHYIKNIDSIINYDKDFKNKYVTCKNLFERDRSATIVRLTLELNKLSGKYYEAS